MGCASSILFHLSDLRPRSWEGCEQHGLVGTRKFVLFGIRPTTRGESERFARRWVTARQVQGLRGANSCGYIPRITWHEKEGWHTRISEPGRLRTETNVCQPIMATWPYSARWLGASICVHTYGVHLCMYVTDDL